MDGNHHPNNQPVAAGGVNSARTRRSRSGFSLASVRTLTLVLVFGVLIILICLIAYIGLGKYEESSYINTNEFQSVFVNVAGSSGGQAYFGHIETINSNYIVLDDVFYLESGSTSNQFTLNNLSCALYNPADQMIINRQQVDFWENLKSNSQVTQDINKWTTDKLACSSSSTTSDSTTPSSTSPTTSK